MRACRCPRPARGWPRSTTFLPLLRHRLQLRTRRATGGGAGRRREGPRTGRSPVEATTAGPPTPAETRRGNGSFQVKPPSAINLRQALAVDGTEHVAAALAVHEAVEPHVADPVAQVGVGEQLHGAADVVLVDVRDDERLVRADPASSAGGPGRPPMCGGCRRRRGAGGCSPWCRTRRPSASPWPAGSISTASIGVLLLHELDVDLAVGDEHEADEEPGLDQRPASGGEGRHRVSCPPVCRCRGARPRRQRRPARRRVPSACSASPRRRRRRCR